MFGASGISIDILIFAVALVYANLFEYAFHRWLMHRLHGFVKREHMNSSRHFSRRPSLPRFAIRRSSIHPF